MATMEQTRMSTREKIRERRLERMRLGQAACDFVTLPSDPEIRVAIVPLVEADYRNVLEKVSKLAIPDDYAGMAVKDRVQSQEILVRAIREEHDLTERIYNDVDELMEDFEVGDVDHAIDVYNEMIHTSSPALDGIPPAEFEALKKVLERMDWNALSGSAWFAAKRFLSRISPQLQEARLPGSFSTSTATTKNEESEPILDA
jgi:hypothetical protein